MKDNWNTEVKKDWYINSEFIASKDNYLILDGILYEGMIGHYLQDKENKTENLAMSWNVGKLEYGSNFISTDYTLFSFQQILNYVKIYEND